MIWAGVVLRNTEAITSSTTVDQAVGILRSTSEIAARIHFFFMIITLHGAILYFCCTCVA